MKVLYWSGLFWPHIGGVEVLSLQFIPAMQAKGYEFIVLTSQSNPDLQSNENYNGIPIYRLPFHKGGIHNLENIKEIKQKVEEVKKDFKPDLVHINSIDISIFFHLLTDNSNGKVPTLFSVHSLPPYYINNNTLLYKLLCNAQWITTASAAMLSSVRKITPNKIQCSSLIYYGLNIPAIEPNPLQLDTPRLLCLGRLVNEKGFDLALDAFKEIINHFPKARLIIAGDGPAKPDLETKVNKLDIAGFVEFTGWVSPEKIPELINTSAIVIIPSRWEEPFGLVALQAAQISRPVIAARAGGLPEIVMHQKTGLLFEKENSIDLAKQVISLLANKDMAVEMGRAAREKAIGMFGFDRFIDAYDDLYKKLIVPAEKVNL